MLVQSPRVISLASLLLLAGWICLAVPLSAQDQKKDPAKKNDPKITKKDDKKDTKKDTKKDKKDIKKDTKKNPKEIKKEELKPDLTKEKRDTPILEMKGHGGWINSLTFSSDGKSLLSASRDRTVKIWELPAGKDVLTFKGNPDNVKAAVFLSPDKIAGSTGKWNKEKKAWEGEIRIWDRTGKVVKSLKGHTDAIECLAVSKDGKFLASGSDDHTVKVWDLSTGKDILTFKAHAGDVHGLAFSPDGKRLASAGEDKAVRIWNLVKGLEPIKRIETKKEEPKKEEPKKDPKKGKGKGKGKDKGPKTIEPKEKLDTPALEIKGPGRAFTCVTFSADGKKMAAGNLEGVVKVWDVDGYKEIAELKTNEGVWSVAFNADASKVAAGSWDWAVRVFDVKSGKELQIIYAHSGTVTALAFSSDGKLATGGLDNLIKIWDLSKIQRVEVKK